MRFYFVLHISCFVLRASCFILSQPLNLSTSQLVVCLFVVTKKQNKTTESYLLPPFLSFIYFPYLLPISSIFYILSLSSGHRFYYRSRHCYIALSPLLSPLSLLSPLFSILSPLSSLFSSLSFLALTFILPHSSVGFVSFIHTCKI